MSRNSVDYQDKKFYDQFVRSVAREEPRVAMILKRCMWYYNGDTDTLHVESGVDEDMVVLRSHYREIKAVLQDSTLIRGFSLTIPAGCGNQGEAS